MGKKQYIVMAIMLTVGLFTAKSETGKLEVVSTNEERGIALEWAHPTYGATYSMVMDADHNVYTRCVSMIAKYDPDGKELWKSESFKGGYPSNEIFYNDGYLYFYYYDIYQTMTYGRDTLHSVVRKGFHMLIKMDAKTGKIVGKMPFRDISKPGIAITNQGEIIVKGGICDGSNIEEIYDSMIRGIRFEGMNDSTLKTDKRAIELTDYYIAKLDTSFHLVWDMVLGTPIDTPLVGKPSGGLDVESGPLCDIGLDADTLYISMMYHGYKMDMSPDHSKTAIVKATQRDTIWNSTRDNYITIANTLRSSFGGDMGWVIARYCISGSSPRLLSYKGQFADTYTRSGQNLTPYFKGGMSIFYQGSKDYDERCMFARVGANCFLVKDEEKPIINRRKDYWEKCPYKVDEEGNLFFCKGVNDSLNLNYDGIDRIYKTRADKWRDRFEIYAKFDKDNKFLWSIIRRVETGDYNLWRTSSLDPKKGVIYLASYKPYPQENVDFDPNPEREWLTPVDKSTPETSPYYLVKYHETYKITTEETKNGSIVVPDSMAWHGKDYEIEAVPDDGYKVKSITTDNGRIEELGNGKYRVKNITEPMHITATFIQKGNSVDEVVAEKIEITPSVVEDEIRMTNVENLDTYRIIDVLGRVCASGNVSHNINVGNLGAGRYQLEMEGNNRKVCGEFLKR